MTLSGLIDALRARVAGHRKPPGSPPRPGGMSACAWRIYRDLVRAPRGRENRRRTGSA
jgi:hypothetical protein